MQASELFKQSNTILLDGGMGTMLQASGLKLGAKPEELNITNPELIESIHAKYAAAGSRIVNANTFGASAHKLAGSAYSLEEIIAAGIANCKRACAPYGALAALDVGPLGELLEPNGTLAFEDAVEEYARIVRAGAAAGADLIFFETFTDLYELKAALLAARENSSLPILASMSFEAGGRTFTGCTVESFGVTARGLGASAVGINCSLGPKEIFPMAKRLTEAVPGNFTVFVKPNAALPRADGSGYAMVKNPDPADRLHLRTEPTKSAASLGKYYTGTPVKVIRVQGDWVQVDVFGRQGWMMKKYLDFSEPYTIDLTIFPGYDGVEWKKDPDVYQKPDENAGTIKAPNWMNTYVIGILEDGWYHIWNPWTDKSGFTKAIPSMRVG